MKPRKTPMRTCVACQTERVKGELVRVVRTPEGQVELDSTGKQSGRGAYLCPSVDCLDRAQKRKALERALGVPIAPETFATLKESLK
jgi:predicted RNA-binding protein YlxR (DUF448 family)